MLQQMKILKIYNSSLIYIYIFIDRTTIYIRHIKQQKYSQARGHYNVTTCFTRLSILIFCTIDHNDVKSLRIAAVDGTLYSAQVWSIPQPV